MGGYPPLRKVSKSRRQGMAQGDRVEAEKNLSSSPLFMGGLRPRQRLAAGLVFFFLGSSGELGMADEERGA